MEDPGEMSRAERSKAEQSRAEQSKAEQSREMEDPGELGGGGMLPIYLGMEYSRLRILYIHNIPTSRWQSPPLTGDRDY